MADDDRANDTIEEETESQAERENEEGKEDADRGEEGEGEKDGEGEEDQEDKIAEGEDVDDEKSKEESDAGSVDTRPTSAPEKRDVGSTADRGKSGDGGVCTVKSLERLKTPLPRCHGGLRCRLQGVCDCGGQQCAGMTPRRLGPQVSSIGYLQDYSTDQFDRNHGQTASGNQCGTCTRGSAADSIERLRAEAAATVRSVDESSARAIEVGLCAQRCLEAIRGAAARQRRPCPATVPLRPEYTSIGLAEQDPAYLCSLAVDPSGLRPSQDVKRASQSEKRASEDSRDKDDRVSGSQVPVDRPTATTAYGTCPGPEPPSTLCSAPCPPARPPVPCLPTRPRPAQIPGALQAAASRSPSIERQSPRRRPPCAPSTAQQQSCGASAVQQSCATPPNQQSSRFGSLPPSMYGVASRRTPSMGRRPPRPGNSPANQRPR